MVDPATEVDRLGASAGGVGAACPRVEVGAVVSGGHVACGDVGDVGGRVRHDGGVSLPVVVVIGDEAPGAARVLGGSGGRAGGAPTGRW